VRPGVPQFRWGPAEILLALATSIILPLAVWWVFFRSPPNPQFPMGEFLVIESVHGVPLGANCDEPTLTKFEGFSGFACGWYGNPGDAVFGVVK